MVRISRKARMYSVYIEQIKHFIIIMYYQKEEKKKEKIFIQHRFIQCKTNFTLVMIKSHIIRVPIPYFLLLRFFSKPDYNPKILWPTLKSNRWHLLRHLQLEPHDSYNIPKTHNQNLPYSNKNTSIPITTCQHVITTNVFQKAITSMYE